MTQAVKKSKTDPRVETLRQVLRNLIAFRALYETDGVSELVDPDDGNTWSLWDLETFYETAVRSDILPLRQRQAIEFFLVRNMPEDKVAGLMGIKASNPIGMYATSGLSHILRLMDAGEVINLWGVSING